MRTTIPSPSVAATSCCSVNTDQFLDAINKLIQACISSLEGDGSDGAHHCRGFLPKASDSRTWKRCAQRWELLAAMKGMIDAGQKYTLRHLYYRVKPSGLFPGGSSEVSSVLTDILGLMAERMGTREIPRNVIRMTTAPKGECVGPSTLVLASGDRRPLLEEVWAIPGDIEEVRQLKIQGHDAKFILVVEKDTIFNRLRTARFHQAYLTVLCTGKGFPDLGTRCFVRQLSDALDVPTFALTDWNPAGVQIFMTYKEGASTTACMEGDHVRVPNIRWLGLHAADVCNLRDECFEPFTARDRSACHNLVRSVDGDLLTECQAMLDAERKVDLDLVGAVCSAGLGPRDTFSELIAQKLVRQAGLCG